MKASDIHPGGRYLVAVVIPAGPRTPRMRATKQATVIAVERSTVTIEVTEMVCVNRHEIPDNEIAYAQFVTGRTRWEKRPVRREVRATDILRPLPDAAPAPAPQRTEAAVTIDQTAADAVGHVIDLANHRKAAAV